MFNRDNGAAFALMALGLFAAGVHLSQNAAPAGARNRQDDDLDDDDLEDDDTNDSSMALSNLMAARRHADAAIGEVKAGAEIPPWAADRITRAQQSLGDVSNFLVGRRSS